MRPMDSNDGRKQKMEIEKGMMGRRETNGSRKEGSGT